MGWLFSRQGVQTGWRKSFKERCSFASERWARRKLFFFDLATGWREGGMNISDKSTAA